MLPPMAPKPMPVEAPADVKRTETPPSSNPGRRKRKIELAKLAPQSPKRRVQKNPYAEPQFSLKKPRLRSIEGTSSHMAMLRAKYPRLLEKSMLSSLIPKKRSYPWLLRLVEEILDSTYEVCRSRPVNRSI